MITELTDLVTPIFDGAAAQLGFQLNDMCFSFNNAANRERYKSDPEKYFDEYHLTDDQKTAVRSGVILDMIKAGGNAYYLMKLAGIYGLDVQDIGAQQTGVTKDEFILQLKQAGA